MYDMLHSEHVLLMGFEDIARCICSSLASLAGLTDLLLVRLCFIVSLARRPGNADFVDLRGIATGLEEDARRGEVAMLESSHDTNAVEEDGGTTEVAAVSAEGGEARRGRLFGL